MYPPAADVTGLREMYASMQSTKGGKREVLDRILEGDWRNGITQYQLAMADMQYLADRPNSQRWTALDLVRISATEGKGKENDRSPSKRESDLPRLHVQTFLRNLQHEISPIVKAPPQHFYTTRSKTLPVTFIRLHMYDTPYGTQHSMQPRGSKSSLSAPSSSAFVAFPDGTPTIYVSHGSGAGTAGPSDGRDSKKMVIESIPKALSKPHRRYRLEPSQVSARSLPALLSLRGPGRSNAASGGWIIYAEGNVEAGPLETSRKRPILGEIPAKSSALNEMRDIDLDTKDSGRKSSRDESDERIAKRRKLVAEGRFGSSAVDSDGKGIEKCDLQIKDPFSGPSAASSPARNMDAGDARTEAQEPWTPNIRLTFQGAHVFAGIRKLAEMGLIDGQKMPGWMTGEAGVGINLTDPVFHGSYHGKQAHEDDLDEVIARAKAIGCEKFMVTGSSLEESRGAVKLAQQHPGTCYATVGVHPCSSKEFETYPSGPSALLAELKTLATEASRAGHAVAFGEIGLDYDRLSLAPKDIQLKYFEQQLDLAVELHLPLFLHSRAASEDFERLVAVRIGSLPKRGLVHSFTGTVEEMRRIVALGLDIGVNGCSLKTEENLEVVRHIPLDRLQIETDGPWCEIRPSHASSKYLADAPPLPKSVKKEKFERGLMVKGRNESVAILRVAHVIAKVKEISIEEVAEAAWNNSVRMFGLGVETQ
ncbi:MAG: hypothetical protein M4579_006101 [Chaenotheca gracillima]|nr:MAG: hypothetical protein M4579_006101 [Chaenotheca gracillima]